MQGVLRVGAEAAQLRGDGGRAGHDGVRRLPPRGVAPAAAFAAAAACAGGGSRRRRRRQRDGAAREAAAAPPRRVVVARWDRGEALRCMVRRFLDLIWLDIALIFWCDYMAI